MKQLTRAAEYEMGRVAKKEKLLVAVARRARAEDGSWKSSDEFRQIIKDVVRGMGEASSKGRTGGAHHAAQTYHSPTYATQLALPPPPGYHRDATPADARLQVRRLRTRTSWRRR